MLEAYNFFVWVDNELSDRYKVVRNGFIRSKNIVEEEHRKICKTMRVYKIAFCVFSYHNCRNANTLNALVVRHINVHGLNVVVVGPVLILIV